MFLWPIVNWSVFNLINFQKCQRLFCYLGMFLLCLESNILWFYSLKLSRKHNCYWGNIYIKARNNEKQRRWQTLLFLSVPSCQASTSHEIFIKRSFSWSTFRALLCDSSILALVQNKRRPDTSPKFKSPASRVGTVLLGLISTQVTGLHDQPILFKFNIALYWKSQNV